MDGLDTLKAKYLTAVANVADEAGLEDLRLAALGKKGEISPLSARTTRLPPSLLSPARAASRSAPAALGRCSVWRRTNRF